jgi:hypothetical protein
MREVDVENIFDRSVRSWFVDENGNTMEATNRPGIEYLQPFCLGRRMSPDVATTASAASNPFFHE